MQNLAPKLLSCGPIASLLLGMNLGVSAQTLTHRYSFNETAGSPAFNDSVGGASWAGSLIGSAALDGAELRMDGGGWGLLPPGVIQGYEKLTIEFWATFSPDNPTWTRTIAFGEQTGTGGQLTGLDYCHHAGGDWQNLNLTVTNRNVWANNPGGLNGRTNVHVTLVIDPANNRMYYFNGTALASNPGVNNGTVPALSGMNATVNLIGKSLWDNDAPLQGSMNELRIYNGVITQAQLALNDASGPDSIVTDPGAIQSVQLASPANPLTVGQISPQVFTGNFANVSGVNLVLYGGATYASGNTGVLTVNADGVVTGVAPGTTTLVASYGGLSATNTLSVIAVPATLAHRYSFAADASDSIGSAHGTVMGSASVASGKLVLDGNFGSYLDLPGNLINISSYTAVTIDAWVDFGDVPEWSRLFNFGNDGGSSEIIFSPRGFGAGNNFWFAENKPGGRIIEWRSALRNVSAHLTCVIDPPTGTMALYIDGKLLYARYDATASLAAISTNLAVIGRSLVGVDPYMPGSVDEFRIYRGALSGPEIALVHQNGPNSIARDPGPLTSVAVPTAAYPAYSPLIAPVILANYANLANFSLLPNNSASALGLTVTSSDPAVVEVLPGNMIRTFRPGTATLTAVYRGFTNSAVITVKNIGVLTHRYSFASDANDSVGTAHGTLQGFASVSGGNLVLDGSEGSYLELPPGLLASYNAVTLDTWVTLNAGGNWARLLNFGDFQANEMYVAPFVLGATAHRWSTGLPHNANNLDIPPAWENQSLHITCVYGNGSFDIYTNGVLHASAGSTSGRLDQIGTNLCWIGRSPFPDPYLNANVNEFRIYQGRLAPDEILALHAAGPDQLLSTTAFITATRSGGNIILSWPAAAAGFSVQTKSALAAGNWTTLTNAPALVGGDWQVTIPVATGPQFYRLWR